jgi:hypothetical protein
MNPAAAGSAAWRRRRGDTWLDHENINDVMLATSLEPEGFLLLGPARG